METKNIEYIVSEGKPVDVILEEGTEAAFSLASIKKITKGKETTLSAEFSAPECHCCNHEPERTSVNLISFKKGDKLEREIFFFSSVPMKSKFIVDGPGVITVKGIVGPEGFCDFGEEEEEEEFLYEEEEEEKAENDEKKKEA